MFANVRLMIVAISASLLAVICAMSLFMAVFAAFSVAHEPFATLTAARPSLQIALADDLAAPVADGKPATFGVRFQVKAPPVPNGPVIVAVPSSAVPSSAVPTSPAPHEAPPVAEPVTNAAANAQQVAVLPREEGPSSRNAADPGQPVAESDIPPNAPADERVTDKAGEAKPESIAGNNASAASDNSAADNKAPPELSASDRASGAASTPHHPAPQIRIVSREADNPASVTTAPAPSLVRNKVMKRRKLAAHLRQSHHFRRPRIHEIAAGRAQGGYATGIAQPNSYQPAAPSYTTGTYAQSNGFIQPGFGYTPAVIRPRAAKFRHAASDNSTRQ